TLIAAVCVTVPPALSVSVVAQQPSITALIAMLPAAVSVNADEPLEDQTIGALTVMLPASLPVAPVVIVTLVPALSAVSMSPLLTLAPVPVEVQVMVASQALLLVADVLIVVF